MARRKLGGRPPLGRVRHQFRLTVEERVLDELFAQSAATGYPRTTYLERVVALAHGYESRFLPPPAAPLPIAVPGAVLQEHTSNLRPDNCGPARADVPCGSTGLRLEAALREQIVDWCDMHEVDYAGYLRSILRLAAGFDSVDQLQPTHIQPQLDLDERQERPKAS